MAKYIYQHENDVVFDVLFMNNIISQNETAYMIKKGLAKHEFGAKQHWIDKIKLISNSNLPKREENNENNK